MRPVLREHIGEGGRKPGLFPGDEPARNDGHEHRYQDQRSDRRREDQAQPCKDQRVTHAAITENKRLGAVLEFIKEEQDKAPPKTPRAGKQRSRYEPTGRRNDGWNSLAARRAKEARKASQGCDI